jgi:hypothetical protein
MLNRRNIVPKQWTPALTGVPGPAHLKLVVTGRAGGGGGLRQKDENFNNFASSLFMDPLIHLGSWLGPGVAQRSYATVTNLQKLQYHA